MPKKQPTNQEIVKSIIENEYYQQRLVYVQENDSFLWYDDDNNYNYMSDLNFAKFLFDYIIEYFSQVNTSTHIFKELKYLLRFLTPRQIMNEDEKYIAFQDKLFNLKDFQAEEKDKNKITSFNLPFNYEDIIEGKTKKFHKFLQSTFVYRDKNNNWQTDEELLELIQEMCGSFLVADMECSQAWFWVGTGGNGKTVFAKIIQSIFPFNIQSAMNLDTLTNRPFALSHLVGVRLNISAEEESRYIGTDKFKALVFGDQVHAEEKFGRAFEFYPKAKYIFLTNNMPSLGTVDDAIKRRIQIIPFNRRFQGNEQDPFLLDKLKKEKPGIIYWMLEGARRIIQKNYQFCEPTATQRTLQDFVEESSSSICFIKENYDVDYNSKISITELYEHYKAWCGENGRKPLSKINFSKEVKSGLDIEIKSMRSGNNIFRGTNLILKNYDETDF